MEKANDTKANPDIGTSAMTEAMGAVSPVAAKAWLVCMSETAQFLAERAKQDLGTQEALMACRSPVELLKVQADFLTTAMEQYTSYSMRLSKAMVAAMTNQVQDMGSFRSRRYDDVPL